MKDQIRKKAEQLGFCRVDFVNCEPFEEYLCLEKGQELDALTSKMTADARQILPETSCILVLYFPYTALKENSAPYFSRYYPASNASYHAAKELSGWLEDNGHPAVLTDRIPARCAAARAGGWIGKHNLLILPDWGTRFVLQTILTDACSPDTTTKRAQACEGCGACRAACPTGAFESGKYDVTRCIRYYYERKAILPEWMREHVSGLFGCELCQNACPQNIILPKSNPTHEEQSVVDLGQILKGDIEGIQKLIGTNYARKKRLQCQAVLYIGAKRLSEYAKLLAPLTEDEDPQLSEYATWAEKRIYEDYEKNW